MYRWCVSIHVFVAFLLPSKKNPTLPTELAGRLLLQSILDGFMKYLQSVIS